MNPFLISAMATLLHLKRKCPKCKREQMTKPGEKHRSVTCKFCGTKIPPKKTE